MAPRLDRRVSLDLLPPSLQEVAEVIGIVATLKLVEWRGGVRVWVPGEVKAFDPLANAIGVVAAEKLCARFGLEFLWIPKCTKAVRAARDSEIRRRYKTTTAAQLALEYGLTDRQIWAIVARREQTEFPAQPDLL